VENLHVAANVAIFAIFAIFVQPLHFPKLKVQRLSAIISLHFLPGDHLENCAKVQRQDKQIDI
jgi:hypothetical protein